ncbi:MAG: hypothetical protein KGQ32_12435, partial [Xanthomonadaceae bacterium]|nr:hypothetical protein [Xanthomonadaceae bacterium]
MEEGGVKIANAVGREERSASRRVLKQQRRVGTRPTRHEVIVTREDGRSEAHPACRYINGGLPPALQKPPAQAGGFVLFVASTDNSLYLDGKIYGYRMPMIPISLEFFPPKTDEQRAQLERALPK